MSYSDLTLKKLFGLSGNECAYPGCTAPIVDTDMGVVVGEICHIKGKSKNGPRHDPDQPESERNGYENLLVMCGAHNKIVDDPKTRDRFPVELLREFKREHEAKYGNSVVDSSAMQNFVAHFGDVSGSVIVTHNQRGGQNAHQITNIFTHPPKPRASLTPTVQAMLTNVDHQLGLDFYDLRVELRNDGQKTVREFSIEVEIPKRYMEGAGSFSAQVNSRNPQETNLFRHTQQSFGRDFAIFPGDKYPVFKLHYILKKEHYLQGIKESIKVFVYFDDELVSATEYPIAEMLNAERVAAILGPRLAALKKIYQTARDFYGDDGDLTDGPIFLSEEPAEGRRNVHIENAYNMAKALTKEGWLTFENENAMIVKLTDEGIRKAS